jgi:DNA-binding CsgD family transcriptional regulator
VLVAVALRPRQLPERLSAALERAHRAAALTRIELGALTPVEARELLGETVDAAEATVLYDESGGNPFYLEQLARSLERSGAVTPVSEISLTGIGVPHAVAAALSEELALLSEDTRLVLEGAAVAGDPFEPELAALFDAARARELAGRALAQAGGRDRAALELELAAAAFGSFGSLRYRNQAERELRKLGRHIHHPTRAGTTNGSGIESLTERELQVARLVVDRKTNVQIAAELFLSKKTVETHLRNIFRKMGVTTRAALARAVERTSRTASSGPS